MARKVDFTLVSQTGVKFKMRLADEITVDDVMVNLAKAEGFRIRTGKDVAPDLPSKAIRDYLAKTGLVLP